MKKKEEKKTEFEFKVKYGIPIPKSRREGRRGKYKWAEMEEGGCVDIPLDGKTEGNMRASIRASINFFTSKEEFSSRKFITRLLRDEGIYRVWRTE